MVAATAAPGPAERWTSRSGREFIVRLVTPEDEEELLALDKRLSPRSVRLRFLAPRVDFDASHWRRFVHELANVDYHHRTAFVVTDPGGRQIHAVGRYEEDGPCSAEVAFEVEDSLQGQGIGTELLYRLARQARADRYDRFTAWMLAENQPMRDVFRHSGFPYRFASEGELVRVELDIREPPAPPPWCRPVGEGTEGPASTRPTAPLPG